MSSSARVHAFTNDVLADHDASALAELVRRGEVSAVELTDAAVRRARAVDAQITAVEVDDYERAPGAAASLPDGLLRGVPVFVKDNVDVAGLPTNHGTDAFVARPAVTDSPVTTQLRSLGVNVLGKSRLPEFGFSASTEYREGDPVRNPWDPAYSAGASSGGSAALVAAGVVPVAHANDGGGSIRIPAAACGLVGLKPTRGRLVGDKLDQQLPVRIITQGVVTRSVRDTAAFFAGAEQHWRNPRLPPVRHVTGPGSTRLRVGLVLDSVTGNPTDEETRAAVLDTARLMESLGHHVEEAPMPVSSRFAQDFALYWGLLGLLVTSTGTRVMSPDFDVSRTDNLTRGLAAKCRREFARTPATLVRLRRSTSIYRKVFHRYDVLLSPVLGHTTPELGFLSPALEFEELFARLEAYVGFTPLNNVSGGPAISLPMGSTATALPIGVHLSADLGDERTLLEVAYELEAARPFRRIQEAAAATA